MNGIPLDECEQAAHFLCMAYPNLTMSEARGVIGAGLHDPYDFSESLSAFPRVNYHALSRADYSTPQGVR